MINKLESKELASKHSSLFEAVDGTVYLQHIVEDVEQIQDYDVIVPKHIFVQMAQAAGAVGPNDRLTNLINELNKLYDRDYSFHHDDIDKIIDNQIHIKRITDIARVCNDLTLNPDEDKD